MAEMTTPRRAAAWRKTVMKISRPITIATIHHGSPTGPKGVANCSRAASMLRARGNQRVVGWRHQHKHRNQCREQEQLVGERIEEPAKIRDEITRARQHSVVV